MRRTLRTHTPSPSKPWIAFGSSERHPLHPLRWLILITLLAGVASCSQGAPQQLTAGKDMKAAARTQRVRVFLIDLPAGQAGAKSCTAKPAAVEEELPVAAPALEGALSALLTLDHDPYDTRTGFYNALHASPLTIDKIEHRGAEVTVRLNGYLELDDPCDGQRAFTQLQETVLQFSDVQHVQFYLEGKPLQEALAGK